MRQQDNGILFWFSDFFVDSCNVLENAVCTEGGPPLRSNGIFQGQTAARTVFGADP